jgi:hypothetical protein
VEKELLLLKQFLLKIKKFIFRPSGNKKLNENKYLMLSKDFYLNGYQKVLKYTFKLYLYLLK